MVVPQITVMVVPHIILLLYLIIYYILGSVVTGGGEGGRMMVSYTDSEYTGTMVAYGGSSDYSYGGASHNTATILDNLLYFRLSCYWRRGRW